jgi:hypothetical protein
MADAVLLQRLGFIMDVSSPRYKGLGLDSAEVLQQAEMAAKLAEVAFALVATRARGASWYTMYPHCFVLLLADSQEVVDAALGNMKLHWQAWLAIRGLNNSYWQKVRSRSFMRWTAVNAMFTMASRVDFARVTPGMAELAAVAGRHFGSTILIEHSFKFARDRERQGTGTRPSNTTMWRTPVVAKVMAVVAVVVAVSRYY